MAGDTWVANDGRIGGAYFGTCWISDTGAYTGPNPATMLADASWVPGDANTVEYLICAPNPDVDDTHVLDGSYTATDYDQTYFAGGGTDNFGDPAALDSGAHLFLVWFQPGIGRTADPALLVAPSASPLDLAPIGWVSGGRLDPTAGFASATMGTPTFTLSTTGSTGTGDALAILLASVISYDSADRAIAPLGGPIATITGDPRPAMELYTSGGAFKITNMRRVVGGPVWEERVSASGAVSFSMRLADPITVDLTPGRIVKVVWKGQARFAGRLGKHTTTLAIDGDKLRTWNLVPGCLDMLNDGLVLPEYGLRPTSGNVRNFGPMSHFGAWYPSGEWADAVGVFYQDDTGYRKRQPKGLFKANPMWASKSGAYHLWPAGTTHHFRKTFYLAAPITYRLLAGADRHLWLYIDGEEVFTPNQQESHAWKYIARIPGEFTLAAGRHVAYAKVQNNRTKASPIAFWCLIQQTDAKGDPVKGPPLIRTNNHWTVSTVDPGWNPGELVAGLMYENRIYPVPAFSTIGRTFSSDADSHGVPWDEPDVFSYDIGKPVGDVVANLSESKFSAWVNPGPLTLGLYQRMGVDRSATVTLELAEDDPDNSTLIEHTVEWTGPTSNSALVQQRDKSWAIVENATSVAANGRSMTSLSVGSTPDSNTAAKVAHTQFKETAHDQYVFTIEVSTSRGPQVYEDFHLGDSVNVRNENADGLIKVRIMAIGVDASGPVVKVTLDVVKDSS